MEIIAHLFLYSYNFHFHHLPHTHIPLDFGKICHLRRRNKSNQNKTNDATEREKDRLVGIFGNSLRKPAFARPVFTGERRFKLGSSLRYIFSDCFHKILNPLSSHFCEKCNCFLSCFRFYVESPFGSARSPGPSSRAGAANLARKLRASPKSLRLRS